MYSLADLRRITTNGSMTPDLSCMSLQEAIEEFALNEAFFGKKPVIKIQKATDEIYRLVMNNPHVNILNTPQGRALNQSFCDVFGFRYCNVYWNNNPALGYGPCTFPRSKVLHAGDYNAQSFMYGKNQNGFYDKDHVLNVFINTDQTLFTDANMTSEEMVAILLHEIGHNFDYSPYTVLHQWIIVFSSLVEFFLNPRNITPLVNASVGIISDELGGLRATLLALDDILLNIIPPLGFIVRMCRKFGFNVIKLINAVISPVTMATLVPMTVMMTPFNYLGNFALRQGEIYSDSFAASYGYASELATALEKLNQHTVLNGPGDTFLAPFYDLAMLQADIITTCTGGHGSTQQRIKRMIDKLDEDLENSELSKSDRAMILTEKDRLLNTYNKFITCDGSARTILTSSFRQMIDNWYDGKNYMITPIFDRAVRYAK